MKNLFKYISLVSLLFFSWIISVSSQDNENSGKPDYLLGKIDRADWADFSGMDAGTYFPESKIVDEIKANMANIEVMPVLFAGTWCSDSEREVPKIFILLDELRLSDNIKFYAVDRDKNDPGGMSKTNNIQKVPTLILYVDGKEKGRIVETPTVSWERDLLDIISKK